MARHTHDWQPLFHRPPDEAADLRIDLLLMRRDHIYECACGAVGFVSRGYSRGGGHAMRVFVDPATAALYRGEAELWNQRIAMEGRTDG